MVTGAGTEYGAEAVPQLSHHSIQVSLLPRRCFLTSLSSDQHLLMIGIMAGLATIPGNILGRKILKRLKVTSHGYLVDILTLGGGLNFIWMALK